MVDFPKFGHIICAYKMPIFSKLVRDHTFLCFKTTVSMILTLGL